MDASPILLELAVCRASAARHPSAVRNMLRICSVYHRGAWTNIAVKRWTHPNLQAKYYYMEIITPILCTT